VVAIVVLLFVTFGAQSDLMMWLLLKLHELDPQSQVYKGIISGASLGPYAWMLAPIAIVILAALGRSSPFRIAPAAVMMVCVATVTAATSYGAAGFLAGFSGIGARGTASIKDVLPAVDALAIPSLLALGMATLTAMIVIISLWRARDAVALGSGSATGLFNPASIVLAVSMAVSLVAMNQWLLLNQELFDVALALTRPPVRGPRGGSAAQDLIGRTEIAIQMALLGAVIVLTTLATAFAAWRGSRTPHANALLAWTTRLAVVVMLAGCLWHADAIAGQWQIFRAETAHLRSR
jgi:hypothetical protein